jgi:ribosomal protein L24E
MDERTRRLTKISVLQGKLYVRADSKIFRFQNGKSESLFLQRKNPRRIAWTVLFRRQHRKGISEVRQRSCGSSIAKRLPRKDNRSNTSNNHHRKSPRSALAAQSRTSVESLVLPSMLSRSVNLSDPRPAPPQDSKLSPLARPRRLTPRV